MFEFFERRRVHGSSVSLVSVVLLACVLGCSGGSDPRVEEWDNGAFQERIVSAHEISGQRDGASTRAVVRLTLDGGEELELELQVVYDPTPTLGSGRWRIDGPRAGAGDVRAESVRFTGGQGEGPSIGGRYRLEEAGEPRYRVNLPLQSVGAPSWTTQ